MAINLSDYSRTAAQRGWGAGWPSCSGVSAIGTAVVTADRSGTRMSVHKRIARLVDLLIDATEKRHGWLLKPGQCGGYNCRAISGTNSPSNHSWALAVDLNWNDNTYNSTGRHTMPTAVARMWNRYGFAWGGDYSGAKKDWMHLEFMGTPADADAMTALALVELTLSGAIPGAGSAVGGGTTAPPEDTVYLENIPVKGAGSIRRILPTGEGASEIVARSWISAVADGARGGSLRVFFQNDRGGISDARGVISYSNGWSQRWWAECPKGMTQFNLQYDFPDGGVIGLEAKGR